MYVKRVEMLMDVTIFLRI